MRVAALFKHNLFKHETTPTDPNRYFAASQAKPLRQDIMELIPVSNLEQKVLSVSC